jgi:nitroreductase
MNPTIALLHRHRSIRKFTHRKISANLFETVIRVGQCAATSSHLQAYTLIHVTDMAKREAMVELTGGQKYVADASDFLVFCADMKRPSEAAKKAGADVVSGTTEQLLVASVDVALMAQNMVVAAESEGLGVCYIGGIRNAPAEVSELLNLPEQVYPVFGLCLGYPDQDPEIKPRMPLEIILKVNSYTSANDEAQVKGFDATMEQYYCARTEGNKVSNWSKQLSPLFTTRLRLHMKEFLQKRGLGNR